MLRNFIRDRVPKKLMDLDGFLGCRHHDAAVKRGAIACIAGWGIGMPVFVRDWKRIYNVGHDHDAGWNHLHEWLGSPPRVRIDTKFTDIFSPGLNGKRQKKDALIRLNTFIVKLKRAKWHPQTREFSGDWVN